MYALILFFACITTYHPLLTMYDSFQLNEDLANYSTYSNIISFKNDTYGITAYNSFPMSITKFNQDKSKTMHLSSTELLELMNSFFSKNFRDKDYNEHTITNDLKLFFTKNDKRSSNVKVFLDCFVDNTETNAKSFFSFGFYSTFLGTFFQYDNSQDNYIHILDTWANYEKKWPEVNIKIDADVKVDFFFFYTELGITYCVVGSHIRLTSQNIYYIDLYDISRFFLCGSKSIIRIIIQDIVDKEKR